MRTVSRLGASSAARLAFALAAVGFCPAERFVRAAPPTVNSLSPRGLQSGATTTLTLKGANLGAGVRLLAPIALQQVARGGATADQAALDVTVDASAPPGIYPVWIATEDGVSAVTALAVDHLPELPFSERIESLPVALTGALEGSTVLRTSFAGKAGQRVVIEIEGRRLGNSFNPVLRLYDARGLQLGWAQASGMLDGDARIVTQLPADDTYTIELHDALYRGQGPGAFRLKVGDFHFADLVYPLGVNYQAGGKLTVASGSLPEGTVLDIPPLPHAGRTLAPLPAALGISGSQPTVAASSLAELMEESVAPAGAQAQPIPVPLAVNGRLSAAGEEDRYQIAVTPGANLRFDLLAAQAGSAMDGILTLQNVQGVELAKADDRPGASDPLLDYTVPADVDRVVAIVEDLQSRGGNSFVYRLSVTPAGSPDFSLSLLADNVVVPRRGTTVVRVRATRTAYDGPISLSIPNLPQGMAILGAEIPAGATEALLSISAAETATGLALATLEGAGGSAEATIKRAALTPEVPLARSQPSLRRTLPLASARPLPIAIQWQPQSGDEASSQLPLAARMPMKVELARTGGAPGAVRLSLLTSQIVPQKTVKENQVDRQVDDLDRAIRLDGMPTIAGDQSSATVEVIVPGDLAAIPYDIALRGEILAADNTTVLATVTTPARRFSLKQPMVLDLAGLTKVEAKAGTGDSGQLTGTIHRSPGFSAPVKLTILGLPPELPAPSFEVPGDQSQFAFAVSFPYGAATAELPVKVVAESKVAAEVTLRSNEAPLTIAVVPGGPPPSLYRLFEDEPHVVSLFSEGDGQVSLVSDDQFAGEAALKVTPDQRFRARMPGLGVKIAEQPGDGEYRYLRFAWKKKSGANVMLQLNANGDWGAARGEGKAGYRYEAGPSLNPYNGEAVRLAETLPEEWTVVTRDLFADFGAFSLDGLGLTASDGEFALFDHFYLARSEADLAGCPTPPPPEQPLAVFEDQPEFVANLSEGAGYASLFTEEKYSGAASVKITPDQKANPALPGLGVKIRQNPGPGEYRYVRFAWRKQGGERICIQFNHDGMWGPSPQNQAKFRYDAGPGPGESFGAALRVDPALPATFVVVTRDLFADFGEFTLTGLALSPVDGEFALFDHIYLGRTKRDFELVKP